MNVDKGGRLGRMHWPRFYRYEIADDAKRGAMLNRYPGCVIGVAVTVGHYAYCVKWGAAR